MLELWYVDIVMYLLSFVVLWMYNNFYDLLDRLYSVSKYLYIEISCCILFFVANNAITRLGGDGMNIN